jgi:hypothetical protein
VSRDKDTADLMPAPVVRRFDPERVRAPKLSNRIAQAISEAIRDSGRSREQIAADMSAYLDERVTVGTLYQYSSEANERNNIPAHRLMALVKATGDARVLNALIEDIGLIAVERRFEPLLRREVAKEKLAAVLRREIEDANAQWEASK